MLKKKPQAAPHRYSQMQSWTTQWAGTQPLPSLLLEIFYTFCILFAPKTVGSMNHKDQFSRDFLNPGSKPQHQDPVLLKTSQHPATHRNSRAVFRRENTWSNLSMIHSGLAMGRLLLSSSASSRFTLSRPWGCWLVSHLRWSTEQKQHFPPACTLYSHSNLCKVDAKMLPKNNECAWHSWK